LYQWHSYQYNLIFKPFLHQFFTPNVNWLGLTKSYVKSMILVTSRMNIICKKPLCTSSMCDNVYGQCVHSWSWGWQSRWFNWRVSFETISASTTTFPSWTWTSVRSPISHPDFPLWPTHSQSAPHVRQSTCTPIEKKDALAASDLQHESTRHDLCMAAESRYQNINLTEGYPSHNKTTKGDT
jgi:hypothetical protein